MYHALENMIQDQFIPERELKTGERGTVSLLREKVTGKRVVCHRFAGSGEVYDALQNIDCPYLPRLKQVACQDGKVLTLEEYIPGDTLAFVLENRPLPEDQAIEILIHICRALKVLHSLGVVHRDVKPENIILRGDEAVLIDFDASRICKPEQKTDTQVMGTTGYAAPEQFGFSQTDARADIFALGVLLNEMLTRRHPSHELAKGSLQPIIEKCIEVNVDKRYSSVDELLSALSAPPPKASTKLRVAWWILPVVLLVATAIGAGALSGNHKPAQADNGAASPSIISLQANKQSWHRDPNIYGTAFQYDLDGDGVAENYIFGGMFDFAGTPELLQNSGSVINDKPEVLEVAPAVWRQTGENTYEPAENFAPLLSSPTVTLRQVEGEHAAVVEQIDALYGLWSGAYRMTYEYEGVWHYEFTALLASETLTATASTRTDLLSEAAINASNDAYITPFQYDLDGDGISEQYWFGAVSQIEDGTFPLFHDGTSFYEGSGCDRRVAPGVWRQTGQSEYEQVPEFAPLLEKPQVSLCCVEGDVQPWVEPGEDLFGIWTGTIFVRYTHAGVWVYECSAVLAGMELTAAAVTVSETRKPPGEAS